MFAVRTTAGRLAKCVAWRDGSERLHLSYVTYNTAPLLRIGSKWTSTRGPLRSTMPFYDTYQVSRVGRFDADRLGGDMPMPFPWSDPPAPYVWRWNDQILGATGTLPDGTTTFLVHEDKVVLQTAMGTHLAGVLQVETEVLGRMMIATVDLDEPGTERVWSIDNFVNVLETPSPLPIPPIGPRPVPEILPSIDVQLPAALSRGMNVPIEKVRFR